MPTINDAIVVSGSGYTTIGNGGRKLIMLNNGKMVSVVIDKTNSYFRTYISDSMVSSWNPLLSEYQMNISDCALATDGVNIFSLYSGNNDENIYFKSISENGVSKQSFIIDTSQTSLGNVSLAINEAKTELHAAWVSKNSTYPNGFNIRYAKGTINVDGTVTWGAVEQITNGNLTGLDFKNPSIAIANGVPTIFAERANSGNNMIFVYSSNITTADGVSYTAPSSPLKGKTVYNGSSYAQSSPSAIYVPQSINGLESGLVATTWMGKDVTSNDEYYIHFSKSMDGGTTWSTPSKLYLGSYPSITASKNGKLFITYVEDDATKYIESADNGVSWSTPTRMGTGTYPSSLIDFNINISVPLTIRRTVNEVFFSGSWSVETISPTVGERGKILNRQNILTYNITSDSTIGTVTEKINGVVVGTKTLTSGQNTTVNITQSQWDAIPYGKYRNNSAGRNTIEIVTANNTFIYTFEKWFDNTLDVISVTKAVKDSRDYYLPSAKKILSDAINSKGGSTTPTDSIESMAESVVSGGSKRSAEGTIVSDTGTSTVTFFNGSTSTIPVVSFDFSTLPFVPSKLIFQLTNKSSSWYISVWSKENIFDNSTNYSNCTVNNSSNAAYRVPYSNGVVKIPVSNSAVSYDWFAYE